MMLRPREEYQKKGRWPDGWAGFVTVRRRVIMAGDTPVEVGKVMITAAGRKAVERYPARMSPPPRCAISGPGPRNAPLYPALDQSVRFMLPAPRGNTKPEQPKAPEHACPCCGGRMRIIETFLPGQQPK